MKKKILLTIFLVLLLSFYLMNEFLFIFSYKYNGKIGIIDTYINNTYDNLIIYESEYKNNEYKETHGDSLISFLNSLEYNNEIYYYEAVNEDGKIKSENIIAGLEWMKKNNVPRVNISLSSKYKTDELETWIKENNDMTVYCSYNNKLNSLADYPAMYSGVIASGSDNKIKYKDIDMHYDSNKIILINKNGLKFFEGNSFLSLYTMLDKENNK